MTDQTQTVAVFFEIAQKRIYAGAIGRPRTFAQRAAWHILDHSWEIEDRVLP